MNQKQEQILEALGGARFAAMTGASVFAYGMENGRAFIQFSLRVRGTIGGINKVRITASETERDLYYAAFWKIRGAAVFLVEEISIPRDRLEAAFRTVTGLDTDLRVPDQGAACAHFMATRGRAWEEEATGLDHTRPGSVVGRLVAAGKAKAEKARAAVFELGRPREIPTRKGINQTA